MLSNTETLINQNPCRVFMFSQLCPKQFRATTHTRLRARDHYYVHFKHSHWWKRRSRWSKFTTLEGPMEYVCECKMMNVKSTWMDSFLHGIAWIMFHGHLDCFQIPPLGGKSKHNTVGLFHVNMCEDSRE